MASEIDLPHRKPPKQNLLSCFGCRSRRESFKSKPRKEVEENKKMRKKPRRLYGSIRKSASATVPVEDEVGASSLEDVIQSGQLGDVSRYSQRRLEPVVSAAGSHNYSNQQYTRQDADTVKRRRRSPLPPPPPRPFTTSTVARLKPRRDADNRLDPMVGMSIVLVTLIVMVFWGHVCAILCTAAWFYVIPRLRWPPSDRDVSKEGLESAWGEVDLSSEDNKKRVVLEGLLERNRRPDGLLLPPLI
ncbi:hypothetical protein MLD38_040383 [Melastoma candidum]|uniref:Uncharacterized protein n=1 Tax=Melastoma candidum TaxID=119954 RepID=A0ACB9L6K9_9MYRT|nr:hypothetical protein MLD38_040383 [Melastoma candidum]